ncbi:MAG: type VII secretion protein EccB [Pseudonocardiaceae bacterium]
MSTDPATTSQVQAYRFTLRRMESALVRKDAVMLHEPMRHHRRAMLIGVILALLGLAAFFVIGKLSPTGKSHADGIVDHSSSAAGAVRYSEVGSLTW